MISRRPTAALLGGIFLAFAPAAAHAGGAKSTSAELPRPQVLACALAAYHRVEQAGLVRNQTVTVVDYALPSSQRRLWVIEPGSLRVVVHEFVAHGRGSAPAEDPDRAVRFGNQPESHRSSLGTFLTGETYSGEHGYSLELLGLEPGINDRARERGIVMHPADYVGEAFRAKSGGRVGRSWGCLALDPAVARTVIDRIQEGSVVFVAGPGLRSHPPNSPLVLRDRERAAELPALANDQGG